MAALKARLRRILTALHLTGLYALWHRLADWDPRKLRRRARFRRLNEGARSDEICVRPGLRLAIAAASREPFEWFCFKSLEMCAELDAFLRQRGNRQRFLDVGACHGIFSLAFAAGRPAAAALALEPSLVAHAILAENVERNHLANVLVRQVAAGAAPGRLLMRQVWHHLEAISESEAGDLGGAGNAGDGIVEIPVRPLDDLCTELGFAPDLVKIDVEGFELAVLAGARGLLARHRPCLFLEVHPARLRELGGSLAEVVRLLEELGYRFESLAGAPLSGPTVVRRQEVSRLVCFPT